MTVSNYNWIKQIPTAVLQKEGLPLMGFPPPFPWDKFSEMLGQILEMPSLEIHPAPSFEIRSDKDLFTGLGDHLVPMHIELSPTGGKACWVMAKQDIAYLMSLILLHEENPLTESIDPDYQEGFYHFIAIEAIHAITKLNSALSLQILHNPELPTEASVCLDIALTVQERTLWGRLFISKELQQHWKEKYAVRTLDIALASKLDLNLNLEVGRFGIGFNEWSNVQLGDFIILDSCSITPDGEGEISFTVDSLPLFNGKISQGKITIIEYSSLHEVDAPMEKIPADDNTENEEEEIIENDISDEDDLEEFDENEDELEDELEDEENGVDGDDDEENDDFAEEDEDLESDEFTEEEKEGVEEAEHENRENWPLPPEPKKLKKSEELVSNQPAKVKESRQKPLSPQEIPLTIVIEVGKIEMSIQKIMELQPGNVLDLNIHPENGVDLVVNGRRIGKGELLQIGDILGVRILDIG